MSESDSKLSEEQHRAMSDLCDVAHVVTKQQVLIITFDPEKGQLNVIADSTDKNDQDIMDVLMAVMKGISERNESINLDIKVMKVPKTPKAQA